MIKHVLADGTVLKDVTGHIVKVMEAKDLYRTLKTKQEDKNQ